MKIPPSNDPRISTSLVAPAERDRRFLIFIGAILIALALGLKSELVPTGQVWGLAAGLLVVAVPALIGYLQTDRVRASFEHFIPVLIGAMAVAGLSVLMSEWWKYAITTVAFGVGFFLAAQLDYRRIKAQEKPGHLVIQELLIAVPLAGAYLVVLTNRQFPVALQMALVYVLSSVAAYRSFRVVGRGMPQGRAALWAFFVGQPITFAFWAMTLYLTFNEGAFAVILLLVWYVNRGIIRHTYEDNLTRQVLLEYGAFAVLAAFLFFTNIKVG